MTQKLLQLGIQWPSTSQKNPMHHAATTQATSLVVHCLRVVQLGYLNRVNP